MVVRAAGEHLVAGYTQARAARKAKQLPRFRPSRTSLHAPNLSEARGAILSSIEEDCRGGAVTTAVGALGISAERLGRAAPCTFSFSRLTLTQIARIAWDTDRQITIALRRPLAKEGNPDDLRCARALHAEEFQPIHG